MTQIKFKGNTVKTIGQLPAVGSTAPEFKLTATDLSTVTLDSFKGKKVILNIFPSLDTSVCATSVRKFNAEASKLSNVSVVCISKDLPFAHSRFCSTEGLDKVVNLSEFKDADFGKSYGVTMADGPLEGLLSRAIVVLDENRKIKYTEQVPEITQEPDYIKALEAVK